MPGPKPRFKHTYAPKQNLENLESHIVNAENNRSNHFKNRIGLIIQIFLITGDLQMEIKYLLFILGILGIPQWLSGLVPPFSPGCDPGVPGLSPSLGSLHGTCVSASLSLSVCVSLVNK